MCDFCGESATNRKLLIAGAYVHLLCTACFYFYEPIWVNPPKGK